MVIENVAIRLEELTRHCPVDAYVVFSYSNTIRVVSVASCHILEGNRKRILEDARLGE